MSSIQTARGPVGADELGNTLAHEHIITMTSMEYVANYRDDWNTDERIDQAVAALDEAKRLGVDTIFDCTVLGLGRYVPWIQRIAARTDMNIVMATGLYTYRDVPLMFHTVGPGLAIDIDEPMTPLFVNDLEKGIAGTDVRAAFLKCAIDEPGMTPGIERVMRAVARASVETGAPITVHTHPATRNGLDTQRVLREEGVDLTNVVIGHSGDSTDIDYLVELADAGSYLGMDRFGLGLGAPDRIATITTLIERGYLEQLVISHDAMCYTDFLPPGGLEALPDYNYRFIPTAVLPMMREAGITDEQIDTMFRLNPQRYITGRR
ncbi:phosphotriesterase-related protein [Pseudonocardia xishanensis]|uniref:Phosphotriesterase n=1 Tax=Pseudonocardia xishanensis TaxID=630995 RepID=A0ABP8S0I4_9PSEU